jgi:hypothetical protein
MMPRMLSVELDAGWHEDRANLVREGDTMQREICLFPMGRLQAF